MWVSNHTYRERNWREEKNGVDSAVQVSAMADSASILVVNDDNSDLFEF